MTKGEYSPMAILRTRRLATGAVAARAAQLPSIPGGRGAGDIYTTPVGYRAVVKDVRLYSNVPTGGTDLQIYIRPSGGAQVTFHQETLPAGATTHFWTGDVVLEPQDVLGIYSSASAVTYYVSGAELWLPGVA